MLNIDEVIRIYIIEPIEKGLPYNPVSTFTYLSLLAFFSYITYIILKKLRITLNYKFLLLLTPYILLGTFLRVMVDLNYIQRSILTVTPGVWINTWLITLFLLILLKKGIINKKIFIFLGAIPSIILFYLIIQKLSFFKYFFLFIIYFPASFYAYLSILNVFKIKYKEAIFLGFAHCLDSVSSSLAISYKGFIEEHIFTSFIIYSYPELYVALKILLSFFIVYLLKDFEEFNRNFLILIAYLIGIGPGIRNFILLFL